MSERADDCLTSPIWVMRRPKFSPTLTVSPTPIALLLISSSSGSSLLLKNSMIAPTPSRITSASRQLPLGELDDDRDLQAQDALQLVVGAAGGDRLLAFAA